MKKGLKKWLSMLLAAASLLSVMCTPAMAAGKTCTVTYVNEFCTDEENAVVFEDIAVGTAVSDYQFEVDQYGTTAYSDMASATPSLLGIGNTDLDSYYYQFSGWYSDESCTKKYDMNQPLKGDLTLYADYALRNFADISIHRWYCYYVQVANNLGLMNGSGDFTFSPDGTSTRAEFVQSLYALAGKPEVEVSSRFSDVAADAWYAKAVTWAVNNGVTGGTSADTFSPDAKVTRQEVAVFLYAYSGKPEVQGDLEKYADSAKVDSWAVKAITWATVNGIMSGSAEGSSLYLNPVKTSSRAETATMMVGFCHFCAGIPGEYRDFIKYSNYNGIAVMRLENNEIAPTGLDGVVWYYKDRGTLQFNWTDNGSGNVQISAVYDTAIGTCLVDCHVYPYIDMRNGSVILAVYPQRTNSFFSGGWYYLVENETGMILVDVTGEQEDQVLYTKEGYEQTFGIDPTEPGLIEDCRVLNSQFYFAVFTEDDLYMDGDQAMLKATLYDMTTNNLLGYAEFKVDSSFYLKNENGDAFYAGDFDALKAEVARMNAEGLIKVGSMKLMHSLDSAELIWYQSTVTEN